MRTRFGRLAPVLFWAASALALAAPAHAQFGVGGRFAMIRSDVETDEDSVRFTGGHIRARVSPRTAVELSLDLHSQTSADETLRVRDYPIQASLLLYPLATAFSPYLLGGGGWYSQRVQTLNGDHDVVDSTTTRDFGWHAGFGAELKLGRHAGLHADYRYTFLDFGSDDESDGGAAANGRNSLGSVLPSYKGSMWTMGLTVYF